MAIYKLVLKSQAVLTSSDAKEPFQLQYRVGEWTKPTIPESKLFVYGPDFSIGNYFGSTYTLYECEVQGELQRPLNLVSFVHSTRYCSDDHMKAVKDYWRLQIWKRPVVLGRCVPPLLYSEVRAVPRGDTHVRLVDAIRLTKKVG